MEQPSSRRRYELFRRAYRQRGSDHSSSEQHDHTGSDPASFLHRYLAWLRPYWRPVALLLTVSLVVSGLDMLHPLFMRYCLDGILLDAAAQTRDKVRSLWLVSTGFLVVIGVSQAIDGWRLYRQRTLNTQLLLALRRALHRKLLQLPLAQLARWKTGGVVSRLSGDVEATTGLLQMAVMTPGAALLRLAIAVVILVMLNWKLALAALVVIPGIMLASYVMVQRVRPVYREMREDAAGIDGRAAESFSGLRTVRAFGRETTEHRAFVTGHHTIARKELFAFRREIGMWCGWGLLMASVSVVIVWWGGYLYLQNEATIGDIMAFQWYALLLLNPAWRIVESLSEVQRSLAAVERVFDALGMPSDMSDLPDAEEAPSAVREIRFDGIGFAYRQGHAVIQDFNLVVPGGTAIALVGRSGAGKTTLTDLVARFHDPLHGRILVNGTDIRRFRLASYRQLLGVVQQDVFLFDGSVMENIRYGRRDASDEAVIAAAQQANAHEFIARLPESYGTIIGERGVRLSGGERQRLAIARALVADPQILILDEATSNLDSHSEQLVQESLERLLRGRTTFVIAHRMSTVRMAHRIVVIDQGRLLEQGTHEELLSRQGLYAEMIGQQFGWDVLSGTQQAVRGALGESA